MYSKNYSLQLEVVLDRWELVALEKFLTSEANWITISEETIKEVGDGIDQEQELRLSEYPFARIVSRSEWRTTSYWDEVTVKVEFSTGIPLMIPGKTVAVPHTYVLGLLKALKLFPDRMQVEQEVS